MDDEDSEYEQKNEGKLKSNKETTKRKKQKKNSSSENYNSATEEDEKDVNRTKPAKKKAKKQNEVPEQNSKKEEKTKKNDDHFVVVTSTGCLRNHTPERRKIILDIIKSQVERASQAAALRAMCVQTYVIALLAKDLPIPKDVAEQTFWQYAGNAMCEKDIQMKMYGEAQWKFDLNAVSKFLISKHPNFKLPTNRFLSTILTDSATMAKTNLHNLYMTTFVTRQRSTVKFQIKKLLLSNEEITRAQLFSYVAQICAKINGYTFTPKTHIIPDQFKERFKTIEDEHLKYVSKLVVGIATKAKITKDMETEFKNEMESSKQTKSILSTINEPKVKTQIEKYIMAKLNGKQFTQRTGKNGIKPTALTIDQKAFGKQVLIRLHKIYPKVEYDPERMTKLLNDLSNQSPSLEIFEQGEDEKKSEPSNPHLEHKDEKEAEVEVDEDTLKQLKILEEAMAKETSSKNHGSKVNRYIIKQNIHLAMPYFYYMWKTTYPTITFNLVPQTSRRPLSILLGASQLEVFLQEIKLADNDFYLELHNNEQPLRTFALQHANEILKKIFTKPAIKSPHYVDLSTVTTNGQQFSFHRQRVHPAPLPDGPDIKKKKKINFSNFNKGVKHYPDEINVTKANVTEKYCISVDPGRINLISATRHGYGCRTIKEIEIDLKQANSKNKKHKFKRELYYAQAQESHFTYTNSKWRRDTKMQYALSQRQKWRNEDFMHIIDQALAEQKIIPVGEGGEKRDDFIQRVQQSITTSIEKEKKARAEIQQEEKKSDTPIHKVKQKNKTGHSKRRRARRKEAKLKKENAKKENVNLLKQEQAAPATKTFIQKTLKRSNDFHSYLRYVDVVLLNWTRIYEHAFQKRELKLKVECYQAKQKAIIKLASRLVGDFDPSKSPAKAVLAARKGKIGAGKTDPNRMKFSQVYLLWGGGTFLPSGKGHPSAPNKLLYDALSKFMPVIITNEKNTSKLTRCCRIAKCTGEKHCAQCDKDKKDVKKTFPIRGVSHCSKCNRYSDRDESASGMIYDLFKQHVQSGEWQYNKPFAK